MSTDDANGRLLAHLQDEVDALERQVEGLREELRALARLVGELAPGLAGRVGE
jgi:prefoldin subunit 5